jgi:hypothetical protein
VAGLLEEDDPEEPEPAQSNLSFGNCILPPEVNTQACFGLPGILRPTVPEQNVCESAGEGGGLDNQLLQWLDEMADGELDYQNLISTISMNFLAEPSDSHCCTMDTSTLIPTNSSSNSSCELSGEVKYRCLDCEAGFKTQGKLK